MDNLLTIHKIEANQIQFRPTALNLKTLLVQLIEMSSIGFGEAPDISLEIADDCTRFYGDSGLIHIIVDNLISNAIKYSEAATTIKVSIRQTETHLQIQVMDEGIGIPPKDQPIIFQAFQRGSNVDVLPGTGVGLAIVQKCVQLHQGTISLKSQVNQGSTFTVRLPLLR